MPIMYDGFSRQFFEILYKSCALPETIEANSNKSEKSVLFMNIILHLFYQCAKVIKSKKICVQKEIANIKKT